ncbi:nickel pincer cofactor biosynthesis protein LarC [Prochlorococcus marinus]|uniref:nickel pincer cofactor biosynthesis protein LarC n=1 Tax=Prochlorococcus marinus TaxID=1219 RepID=UPI0022B56DAD|nr:nickel pincer cofactor biosynthesis protein LarC [Prochlorococcus marinus]
MQDLFIDCSTGISGDMLLAGLIDLGVPIEVIKKPMTVLGLDNAYSLSIENSKSFDLRGCKVLVKDEEHSSKNRIWVDIRNLIMRSSLKSSLKDKILKVFKILAEAESSVHGIEIDKVHFHEIGAIDSIVDIAGVCAAIEYLNPRNLYCSSLQAGSGVVSTSHGILPVPAPAVLELAKNHQIELTSSKNTSDGELTTPTGLALMIVLADYFEKPNNLMIDSIGIGLGHRTLDRPNLLRICLLNINHISTKTIEGFIWEEVILQETWIDDSSPEDISFLINQLRESGAIEVSSQAIQMKKGRLGFCVKALVKANDAKNIRNVWFSFGTTVGVREKVEGRWILPRRIGTCLTSYGKVLVKQVRRPNGQLTIKVEHDELNRIALQKGVTLENVRKEVSFAFDTFTPDEDWTC